MAEVCDHLGSIQNVRPSALGCEESLKTGSQRPINPLLKRTIRRRAGVGVTWMRS